MYFENIGAWELMEIVITDTKQVSFKNLISSLFIEARK